MDTRSAAGRRGGPRGAASATASATASAADSAAVWEPEAGPLRRLDTKAIRHCLGPRRQHEHEHEHDQQPHHVWIHLVGDSTVRFMYAAWLTLLNGTHRAPGYPYHTLPETDPCSFARAGRAEIAPCVARWRGIFAQEEAGLQRQIAQGEGWSLSYEAWHHDVSSTTRASQVSAKISIDKVDPFSRLEARFGRPGSSAGREGLPDLLLISMGVWEAMAGLRLVRGRRPPPSQLPPSQLPPSQLPPSRRPSSARRRVRSSGRSSGRSWLGRERTFSYSRAPEEQRRYYLTHLRYAFANATAEIAREIAGEMPQEIAREISRGVASGGLSRREGGGAAGQANLPQPPLQPQQLVSGRPRLVVMGNGGCRQQQREYWGEVSGGDWPPDHFERLLHEGNAKLRQWCTAAQLAARRDPYPYPYPYLEAAPPQDNLPHLPHLPRITPPLFLDRAATMESVPRLVSSPCFHHHPYGQLSDTHVQIVLNALC